MTAPIEEKAALVALLRTRPLKMSWPELTAEVIESGSAVEVWERLVPSTLPLAPNDQDELAVAADDIRAWQAEGLTFVTVLDAEYPNRLRSIHQAPPVLFARGTLLRDERAVSVVGSREASERGISIAAGIAAALVNEGISVVAGLAAGIDTAAHRGALNAGGRTVAVIGTGIRNVFPAENRALHAEIANRGLLLSQFWPDAPPQKFTFPMRNATMSGFGLATVVVEAGEHSGARIQARMAVEHGRPVILTDMVVNRNVWAKALVGRPGVHVASALSEVLHAVHTVTRNHDEVSDALRLVNA